MRLRADWPGFSDCNLKGVLLGCAWGTLVKSCQNRGGRALAGALACIVILLFAPTLTSAETNVSNNAAPRSRDDKSSSVVNLTMQVVQQLQAQQQTSLHAITEVELMSSTPSAGS
jgi:hypothetical protein